MNPESIATEKKNLTELHQKLLTAHAKLRQDLANCEANIQRVIGGVAAIENLEKTEQKPDSDGGAEESA